MKNNKTITFFFIFALIFLAASNSHGMEEGENRITNQQLPTGFYLTIENPTSQEVIAHTFFASPGTSSNHIPFIQKHRTETEGIHIPAHTNSAWYPINSSLLLTKKNIVVALESATKKPKLWSSISFQNQLNDDTNPVVVGAIAFHFDNQEPIPSQIVRLRANDAENVRIILTIAKLEEKV